MAEKSTVRMLYPKDRTNTLNGYVFCDRNHARTWLSQSFVDRDEIMLEEVTVSPIHRCQKCNGTGSLQSIKATGLKMTVNEFLGGTDD